MMNREEKIICSKMDSNFNGLSISLKNIDVNGKANDLLIFFSSISNLLDCFNSLKKELIKDEKGEIEDEKGKIEDALFCLEQVRGILDCSMEDRDFHAKRIIDAFLRERENES